MEFFSLLDKYLKYISIKINKEQKIQFYKFYQFLKEKNQDINFTRLLYLEDIIRKHFIDSIIILDIFQKYNLNFFSPIMDLGTGGGFPGIPLSILLPEMDFILVESRKNRVEYLNQVKDLLELKNVSIIHKTLTYKDSILCKSVITRALESIKDTAIRTTNSLEKNGLLIFLKGPNCEEEILEINQKFFELKLNYDYTLPHIDKPTTDLRKLIVFEKKIHKEELIKPINRYYFSIIDKIPIKNIESHQNTFFKLLKKLQSSKGIKKENKCIIAGNKIINEFIEKYPQNIIALLFSKRLLEKEILSFYNKIKKNNNNIDYILLSSNLIEELDLSTYPPPYLLVKSNPVRSIIEFQFDSNFLILPLQDPINLGACIRSAYAFGIENIILTKESCNPFLLKSIRSSAGTVFFCNFYDFSFLDIERRDFLLSLKTPIFILDSKGKDIRTIDFPDAPFGILLGEEGKGIPEDLNLHKFTKIKIPYKNPIDSLNVSVACSISLFYIQNKLKIF